MKEASSQQQQVINEKAMKFLRPMGVCLKLEALIFLNNLSDKEANVFIECCDINRYKRDVEADLATLYIDINEEMQFRNLIERIREDIIYCKDTIDIYEKTK